ncbi:hypothetical protein C100_04235 [Sphingobium sp. C100]|uniref:hypothetical protein n=1 Tax=Sphingobium sp. C100 TaxID=1207055 RepID=UPI0003D694F5|nr:hypothetical protein [Sphingobium sp. C100]ETI64956.1 hypothetical protein C100_04235 [Sphingobium sp. C100]
MRHLPSAAALAILLPLAACGSEPARETRRSVPAETGPSDDPATVLAADPERLKTLRRECRIDREAVGTETCEAAARATRMRFMGEVGGR